MAVRVLVLLSVTIVGHAELICIQASTGERAVADSTHKRGSAAFIAGFDRFFRNVQTRTSDGGRLLISELSCTACHTSAIVGLRPKRGPRLDGVGLRLQRAWMLRYLANPATVKPGTTMPDVLHALPASAKDRTRQAIVAFLFSLRQPYPELNSTAGNPIALEFWRKGQPHRGRELYHQVGCVACHSPDEKYQAAPQHTTDLEELLTQLEPDEIQELGLADAVRPILSVPQGDLAAKYTHKSLTYFLYDPASVRPGGRMPSLKLKPQEAADIAAYLLQNQTKDVETLNLAGEATLIEAGRRLFQQLRCANCHEIRSVKPLQQASPLAELDLSSPRSCIGRLQSGVPHFALDEDQRQALRQALIHLAKRESAEESANQRLNRRLEQLNCYACHERSHRGGVGPQRRQYFETIGHLDMGDEGRLPPPLDGIGHKLQQAWLKRVFAGTGDVRPHLRVRMPRYPADLVESLPEAFAREDRAGRPHSFSSAPELVEAGRSLLDIGCVQCHPLRGEHLPGVIGVDLAGIENRVRPLWFRDFLYNPAKLKPRTRMPTFFPNGRSSVQNVLAGDVEQQIAAMWEYLRDINGQSLPAKLVEDNAHNFELIPTDRPILLRTFMKRAGPQAIAVGFPQSVHFAFDSERVRLVEAWRGRFLNAHGTWFNRAAPPAEPLGTERVAFPPGMPLAILADARQPWPQQPLLTSAGSTAQIDVPSNVPVTQSHRFRGYRLDHQGVPTLLYRFHRFDVEDRLQPDSEWLVRRLRIHDIRPAADESTIWFRANVGHSLRRNHELSFTNDSGLKVTVVTKDRMPHTGRQRQINGMTEWIVAIPVKRETTIEVHYQW